MELTQTRITWILFTVMFLSVPVVYFVLLTGGFLPLITIAVLGFDHAVFALISVVHMVVWCPVLYLVARAVSRRVSAMPAPARRIRVAVLCGLLFGMTLLPVYLAPAGDPPRFGDAYFASGCAMHGMLACK